MRPSQTASKLTHRASDYCLIGEDDVSGICAFPLEHAFDSRIFPLHRGKKLLIWKLRRIKNRDIISHDYDIVFKYTARNPRLLGRELEKIGKVGRITKIHEIKGLLIPLK